MTVTIRNKDGEPSLSARITAQVEFLIRGDSVVHIDVVVTDGVLDSTNRSAILKSLNVSNAEQEATESAQELLAALASIRDSA